MSLFDPSEWRLTVDTLEAVVKGAYRERAHLVAFLTALYPASIGHIDSTTPDWPVVTVQTPAGQMSWHIAPEDADLFAHLDPKDPCFAWDGHSTDEKYARLRQLTSDVHTAVNTPGKAAAPAAPQEGQERALAGEDGPQEHPQPPEDPGPATGPQTAADGPQEPAAAKEG